MAEVATHDSLVAELTGGLAPKVPAEFAGSERLRPDGRPRPEFRAELRRIPNLRNALLVVVVAVYPIAVCWIAISVDNAIGWVAAFLAMGIYFQRALTLFHEAAHRLLFSNRRLNDRVGQQIIGWLVFGDGSNVYRIVHTQHHRDEFGPREPDFALYARYPITAESMRRKLVRDAVGISGWKNLKPAIVGLAKSGRRVRAFRYLSGQVVVFAIFALSGHPWLYAFLWLLPDRTPPGKEWFWDAEFDVCFLRDKEPAS